VAAATAAAAAAPGWAGRFSRAANGCGTEYGELDGGFFAGACGTGDFLLAIDDDFFELGFAVVANVFVDGHVVPLVDREIIAIFGGCRSRSVRSAAGEKI
jgi:hypothetical protein